jgi:hypothetical protein
MDTPRRALEDRQWISEAHRRKRQGVRIAAAVYTTVGGLQQISAAPLGLAQK